MLYLGNNAYGSRSPEFAGIVGLNDTLYLPLKKGDNELMLLVGESFGGWGFMARNGNAILVHDDLTRSWDVSQTFKFPESVIYDSERDVLYLSNFLAGGNEFISKVRRNGEIVARHSVPEPGLPNDVACGDSGAIFVSDSQKSVVYRVEGGEVAVWLEAAEISQPNGLLLDGDRLLVGNTGDGSLKAATIADRMVETIACLGGGSIMDGIRSDGRDDSATKHLGARDQRCRLRVRLGTRSARHPDAQRQPADCLRVRFSFYGQVTVRSVPDEFAAPAQINSANHAVETGPTGDRFTVEAHDDG